MTNQAPPSGPRKRRRDRGDDGIWWDRANKCYVGAISPGFKSGGKRNRPSVRGRTKAEVKDKLDKLRDDIQARIRTPATYTIEQCVKDWLDSIERDPHTMETITGQAKNWIYPMLGTTKLKDSTATDADRFFEELAKALGKRSLVMIKSSNGVPIQEISDTVGHKSTHVTETVYRHVIVPAIRGGATVMDDVFRDEDEESA
jgi:hypothetical protein